MIPGAYLYTHTGSCERETAAQDAQAGMTTYVWKLIVLGSVSQYAIY